MLEPAAVGVVLGAVPARMIADLLGGVAVPGTRVTAMVGITGCWCAALALVLVARARSMVHHPLRAPLVVFAFLLVVGFLRAPDWDLGTRALARTASPFLVLLAVSAVVGDAAARRRFLRILLWAGTIPVAVSLAYLAGGQMDHFVYDGIHRLLGAYRNVHTHALVMALVGSLACFWVLLRDTRETTVAGSLLLCGSGACLALSYVRTAVVVFGVVILGLLLLTRRYRLAVGVAVLGVLGIALVPMWSARFEDLWMLLTLTRPEEGWDALGRHRPAIWIRSLTAFADQDPEVLLLGNGLGGHLTFWKPRDPHNEYLALLYQLGPLGPAVYLWLLALGARMAVRNLRDAPDVLSRTLAAYTLAVIAAALVGSAISNTFVARLTPAWWLWALVGIACAGRDAPIPQGSTSKVVRTPADPEPAPPSATRVHAGTSAP